jgi:hypothetical protein
MSETLAFFLIVSGMVIFPLGSLLIARRGKAAGMFAAGSALATLLAFLFVELQPQTVAHLMEETDLALLFPAWGVVPAMAVLLAFQPRLERRLRRPMALLVVALACYCLWDASHLLSDETELLCDDNLASDVCYQSTTWSCAPAAAVSLLRSLDMPANEAEMAQLMNTRAHRGTGDLQTQRALDIKLREHGMTAMLRSVTWTEMVDGGGLALVPVRLSAFSTHMIAVLRADNFTVDVIDPLTGPKRLLREQLETIWFERAVLVAPDLPWHDPLLASTR